MEKIGFFYPTKGVGGAQLLFARHAIHLRQHLGYEGELYYFDLKDGYAANFLKEKKIDFTHVVVNKRDPFEIPNGVTLVLPFDLDSLQTIEKYGQFKEVKFLFYFIEPNLLLAFYHVTTISTVLNISCARTISQLVYNRRFKNVGALLSRSLMEHGLLFMDIENTLVPDFFYKIKADHEIEYLPIPIMILDKTYLAREIQDKIKVFWIGRISKQKYYSLLTLIHHCIAYNKLNNDLLELHIIGDGEYYEKLKNLINHLGGWVTLYSSLRPKEMNELLISQCDILFAMGTSALEGGKYGIPTILVDILHKNDSNYKYKWLSETKGYSLGGRIKNEYNKHTFSEVIETIKDVESKANISNEIYEYTRRHHINLVGPMFWNYLQQCNNKIERADFKIVSD